MVASQNLLSCPPPPPRTTLTIDAAMANPLPISQDIISGISQLFRRPTAFRSPQQAMAAQLAKDARFDGLVILPTGGGKSLVFQLAAFLDMPGAVTIVVEPYISLQNDLLERTLALGIPSVAWHSDTPPDDATKIVYVVVETAAEDAFHQFARGLGHRLRRICLDEVHTYVTNAKFRPKHAALTKLRSLGVPLYGLSASLPPSMEPQVLATLGVTFSQVKVIRTATVRPALAYRHKFLEKFDSESPAEIHRLIDTHAKEPGALTLIFVISIRDSEALAAQLGTPFYNATLDITQQQRRYSAWAQGISPVIVTTTSLSTGIDQAGVRLVIHYKVPFSMIAFHQATGCAGRDGQKAYSYILAPEYSKYDANRTILYDALRSPTCFRQSLHDHVDGHGFPCLTDPANELCDQCQRRMCLYSPFLCFYLPT